MSENTNAVYLGRAIACFRHERGLKRKDLAAAAGISYPFLAEIENGKKWPSFPTLDAIAAVLRTTTIDLLKRAKQIGEDFPVLQTATEASSGRWVAPSIDSYGYDDPQNADAILGRRS